MTKRREDLFVSRASVGHRSSAGKKDDPDQHDTVRGCHLHRIRASHRLAALQPRAVLARRRWPRARVACRTRSIRRHRTRSLGTPPSTHRGRLPGLADGAAARRAGLAAQSLLAGSSCSWRCSCKSDGLATSICGRGGVTCACAWCARSHGQKSGPIPSRHAAPWQAQLVVDRPRRRSAGRASSLPAVPACEPSSDASYEAWRCGGDSGRAMGAAPLDGAGAWAWAHPASAGPAALVDGAR